MIVTLDLTWIVDLMPFLLIGFGIGCFIGLAVTGGPNTSLDRAKHDLEVSKEWIKLVSEQRREQIKKEKWDNKFKSRRY